MEQATRGAKQRQIISRIPHRGMSGEQWGFVIENELVKIWLEVMSPAERETVKSPGIGLGRPLLRKLDEIILRQAETLGWRITTSELVRYRMSEWDQAENGPEYFQKRLQRDEGAFLPTSR